MAIVRVTGIHLVEKKLDGRVELIIQSGPVSDMPTTVVDMMEGFPQVIRYGAGSPEEFEF